jgi:hypothetical protein
VGKGNCRGAEPCTQLARGKAFRTGPTSDPRTAAGPETFRNTRVRLSRGGCPAGNGAELEESETLHVDSTDEVGARVGEVSSQFTWEEGGGACRPRITEREMGFEPTTFSLEG